MKILVCALSSASSPDGVSRHAANAVHCLLYRSEVDQVDLVVGAWQEGYFLSLMASIAPALRTSRLRVHRAACSRSSIARNVWCYRQLPQLARDLQSDIVQLSFPVSLDRSRMACPVVVTLHDLYPYDLPENFGFPRVLLNRWILGQCLAATDVIACVSRSTLVRLDVLFPLHSTKALCIENCLVPDELSAVEPVVRGPFVLVVAQHRKSKDIPMALSVFRWLLLSDPGLTMLIVGNEGPETPLIRRMLQDQLLCGKVMLVQGLSDAQMQWCYRGCEVLLATSRIEGFGLPVVEAMLAGCAVVCSDIPAFREFGEPHCRFVTLDNAAEESFLRAVREVLGSTRPRPVDLPRHSVAVVAERYIQLYLSMLAPEPVQVAVAATLQPGTRGAA